MRPDARTNALVKNVTALPNCYRCADGTTLLQGDCLGVMRSLLEKHFHCCVTSPPYFALRSYLPADHPDKPLEIGSETTIEAFVVTMVEVFRGVWRVLRDDGVLFLNLGDGYTSQGKSVRKRGRAGMEVNERKRKPRSKTLGPKQLIGIPWRVALALQADGWYLRSAIVWHKPSPMPGSQRDRCTSSYEMVFQLTKQPTYYWDMEAVKEPCSQNTHAGRLDGYSMRSVKGHDNNDNRQTWGAHDPLAVSSRVPRDVWTIASEGYSAAHFATFPRALPEKCIVAATSEKGCCPQCGAPWLRIVENPITTTGWQPGCECRGDTPFSRYSPWSPVPCRVLDPFGGAGTTALAAIGLQRHCTLIELAEDYCRQIVTRLRNGLYAKASKHTAAPGQRSLFEK